MNEEEITYWCDVFERYKQAFQSKDGKRISFCEILKDYKQLQNNWNELKKWLQANDIHFAEAIPFKETLRKMQELEQGKDE